MNRPNRGTRSNATGSSGGGSKGGGLTGLLSAITGAGEVGADNPGITGSPAMTDGEALSEGAMTEGGSDKLLSSPATTTANGGLPSYSAKHPFWDTVLNKGQGGIEANRINAGFQMQQLADAASLEKGKVIQELANKGQLDVTKLTGQNQIDHARFLAETDKKKAILAGQIDASKAVDPRIQPTEENLLSTNSRLFPTQLATAGNVADKGLTLSKGDLASADKDVANVDAGKTLTGVNADNSILSAKGEGTLIPQRISNSLFHAQLQPYTDAQQYNRGNFEPIAPGSDLLSLGTGIGSGANVVRMPTPLATMAAGGGVAPKPSVFPVGGGGGSAAPGVFKFNQQATPSPDATLKANFSRATGGGQFPISSTTPVEQQPVDAFEEYLKANAPLSMRGGGIGVNPLARRSMIPRRNTY